MQPEDIVRLVAAVLAETRPGGDVVLTVNPGDAVFLDEGREVLLSSLDVNQGITINPEPRIERGGVLIESPEGVWDAGLDTQLQGLKMAVEEVVEGVTGFSRGE